MKDLPVPHAEIDAKVRIDLIRAIHERTAPPLIVGMLLSVLLAMLLEPYSGARLSYGWLALKLGIGSARLFELHCFRRAEARGDDTEHCHRNYAWLMMVDGLLWGALALVFMSTGSVVLDALLRTIVAGVASVGLFTVIGSFTLGALFVTSMLTPALVGMYVADDPLSLAIGVLVGVVYGGVLCFEAWRAQKTILEALRLRHLNAWIADQHRRSLRLAQQSSAAKTRFLATVSHELRTPLNGILGMAQLLRRTPLDTAQQAQTDVIAQSARHLRSVIDDILDLARVEAGRLQIEAAPFDLRQTVQAVIRLLMPLAEERQLRLELQFEDGLPARWHGDAGRIRQVLHNLIGNAIKFTTEGSVRLEVASAGRGLRFTVRDSGCGISAAALEHVFEPFERAAGPVVGTGLGLPIARQLARAMGGDVVCLRSTEQGSVFQFEVDCLPLPQDSASIDGDADTAPSAEDMQLQHAGARALLVEDNAVNALVATAMLERCGVTVVHARSGEAALEQRAGQRFDIVLMDVQMPGGIDGLETTRRWRAAEASDPSTDPDAPRRVPIVAVTADATLGDREQCLASGMDDHLAKPYEMSRLLALLHQHLDQRLRRQAAPADEAPLSRTRP